MVSRGAAEGLAPWSASPMVRRRRHPAPGGRGGSVVSAPPECWQCQQPDAAGRQKRPAGLPEITEIPSGLAMRYSPSGRYVHEEATSMIEANGLAPPILTVRDWQKTRPVHPQLPPFLG